MDRHQEQIVDGTELQIESRFCGPPQSGNGGYVAGRLASFVSAGAVGVRLRGSPALEKSLLVRTSPDGATLFDGEVAVAEARPVEFELSPPDPPTFEEAELAAKEFRGFHEHVFPGCFVCGPNRKDGEGLRIFPGVLGSQGEFAAPWIPDPSLARHGSAADVGEPIADEFVWAALDCPGAFSFPQPEGKVVLLGEMKVALSGSVAVAERCVLVSWEIETRGRKHFTGSALYGADGACRGTALGLWFEVDPNSVPGP
jgi:hypothetical protein